MKLPDSGSALDKIIGGSYAHQGRYPFAVYLYPPGCGGSLLTSSWVVTCAHCFEGVYPSQVSACVGHVDNRQCQTIQVSQIVRHSCEYAMLVYQSGPG